MDGYVEREYQRSQHFNRNNQSAFNSVEPRSRYSRVLLQHQKAGVQIKYNLGQTDPLQIAFPEPLNSHVTSESQRFNAPKFVAQERVNRLVQNSELQLKINIRRNNRLNRDQKRWDYERQQEQFKHQKILMKNRNKGGAAYNIVNLDYESNTEGQILQKFDNDRAVRQRIR